MGRCLGNGNKSRSPRLDCRDEKRPFFIEGANFFDFGSGGINNNWGFNWGSPQFFYSRRIGRQPEGNVQHAGYSDVPDRTAILGAGKITGKIADGWSPATVHAFTTQENARIDSSSVRFEDVVEPFTSYNVVRTLREFNQGKQAIGFIGTGTLRNLNQAYLADEFNRSSYTLGADGWTNLDSSQTYVTSAWLATSRVQGSASRILSLQQSSLHYYQRPDARRVSIDSSATSLSGYAGRIAINKQKGNFYPNSAFGVISPGFESNDMGFLFRTNIINSHLVLGYQWFNPDGTFRRKNFYVATFRNYDFDGNKTEEGYFLLYNMQFVNYWGINGNLMFTPATLDNQTTRGGPLMANTNHYASSIYFNTDSRNPMVCQLQLQAERSESGGYFFQAGPEID